MEGAGSYSFLDVHCAIVGPGGAFTISEGGIAEEGITVAMRDPKNTMSIGADGTPMHSLHASDGATFTVRVQKTSPINALLDAMYRYQKGSSAFWGRNVMTIANPVAGDAITGRACAFQKAPDYTNATDGGMNEWVFDVGRKTGSLGDGLAY